MLRHINTKIWTKEPENSLASAPWTWEDCQFYLYSLRAYRTRILLGKLGSNHMLFHIEDTCLRICHPGLPCAHLVTGLDAGDGQFKHL